MGQMPDGAMPEGFTPPEGTGQFTFGQGGDPFGGSPGNSDASETEPPQTAAASPSPDTANPPAEQSRSERRQPPEGMGFPGTPQGNQQNLWLTAGLYALLLISAILVIRRVRGHNQ